MVVKLQQKNQNKRKLDIQFRAYDDGVAFRYVSKSK
jgi:alpha-glucosidase